jgi:methionyl-tRNA formyltransferase
MLKVFFLLSNDHLFHPEMLNEILKANICETVGLGIVTRDNKIHQKRKLRQLIWNIRFWGAKGTLRILSILFRRFLECRLFKADSFWSLKEVANHYKVPCYEIPDVNEPSFIKQLKESTADILFVACPQILKKEVLRVLPLCTINKHSGKLPHYRGVFPVFYAMLNNEPDVTLTLHTMTEKIDSGKILVEKSIRRDSRDSLLDLYFKLYLLVPQAFIETITLLGTPSVLEQIPSTTENGTYYSFPNRHQQIQFRRSHRTA